MKRAKNAGMLALAALAWVAATGPAVRADLVYLNEGNKIVRYNTDGTGRTEIHAGTSLSGLELDASGGKLYLGNAANRIESIDLDGSNLMTVVTLTPKTFQPYFELALDKADGKIFLLDQVNTYIASANLDNTGVQTVVSDTPGTQRYRSVEVDSVRDRVYWSDNIAHTITRANLDGSNPTVIVTGLNNVTGIQVDEQNQKLYLGDNSTGTIYRSNLDGTGLIALVTGLGNIFDITLNSSRTGIYAVNFLNQVYYANLDGTGKQLLFTDTDRATGGISGIAVFSPAAVPEPASLAMLACGGLGLLGYARRRGRTA